MRDVVLYTLLSLDGVAEEPGDWMFDIDNDVFENLRATIDTQDDVLLGRGTFDYYWSAYWPTSNVRPFADFIDRTPKHVFTATQPTVSWPNTVLVDSARTSNGSRRTQAPTSASTAASASPRAYSPPISSTDSSSSSYRRSPVRGEGCSPSMVSTRDASTSARWRGHRAAASSSAIAALRGAAARARLAPAPRHHALLETARALPVTESGAGRSGRADSRASRVARLDVPRVRICGCPIVGCVCGLPGGGARLASRDGV